MSIFYWNFGINGICYLAMGLCATPTRCEFKWIAKFFISLSFGMSFFRILSRDVFEEQVSI